MMAMPEREFYFSTIPLPPPRADIFRRMGFRPGVTVLADSRRVAIEQNIDDAMAIIALQGIAKVVPITAIDGEKISLAGGRIFTSAKLAAFIGTAKELLLLAASAGNGIMAAIEAAHQQNDLARAVVFDATASEVVDGALSWMQSFLANTLRREGYLVNQRRFSAGYGDFALSHQRDFYEILDLQRIDITLSASFILIPEKSVTAICPLLRS
ncbi:MAG: hypothetical protein K9K75_01130 [Deltaproteobacteria bacterium]|nr:hypothetical protein [Deltaproteobacteria bacterium]